MLRCADGTLYTGIALDVQQRLEAHRKGGGAKYLRGRAPYTLVFEHAIGDRSAASIVEHRIKGYTKREKERLVQSPSEFRALLDEVVSGDRTYGCQVSQRAASSSEN